jgi:WD40 repeat protein
LEGHTGHVYSVAFSPVGRRIISGSADNTIRVWNAEPTHSAVRSFITQDAGTVAYHRDLGACLFNLSRSPVYKRWLDTRPKLRTVILGSAGDSS